MCWSHTTKVKNSAKKIYSEWKYDIFCLHKLWKLLNQL